MLVEFGSDNNLIIIYRFLYVNALVGRHQFGARSHEFEQIALQGERTLFLCRCFAIVLQVMESPCNGKVARFDAVNQSLHKQNIQNQPRTANIIEMSKRLPHPVSLL